MRVLWAYFLAVGCSPKGTDTANDDPIGVDSDADADADADADSDTDADTTTTTTTSTTTPTTTTTTTTTGDTGTVLDTVAVAAGDFLMGCDTCDADEAPARRVSLSAYAIDRTEVRQSAYQACVVAGACSAPALGTFDPIGTPDLPLVGMSWQQAVDFCAHAGGRLPTEAEWEFACRGTAADLYPWGTAAPDCTLANTSECGGTVQNVNLLPAGASVYGAVDLAGNVWEWTADWYAADAYTTQPATDPQGPPTGSTRVYRGGSSGNSASLARCSNRASTYSPDVGGTGLGFRCAY